jgi:hypothetical protein
VEAPGIEPARQMTNKTSAALRSRRGAHLEGERCLLEGADATIGTADIKAALDELLFSGGQLNAALLGAAARNSRS